MNSFKRFGLLSIFAVYLLIFVGAFVRGSGAGMGCPDWPKCFGKWVPPTNEAELPKGYEVTLVNKRKSKNERLQKMLAYWALGDIIQGGENHDIYKETKFNVTKAWTEYANRIVGVCVGLFVLITMILSFNYIKKDYKITLLCVLAFFLTVFEGLVGSVVVSTNLLPGLITFHMILAVAIVLILIYALQKSGGLLTDFVSVNISKSTKTAIYILLSVAVIQLILGTFVREKVDTVAASLDYTNKNSWVGQLGIEYYMHRSFSIIVLITGVWLYKGFQKDFKEIPFIVKGVFTIIGVEILFGMSLAYLGLPFIIQPLHLLLSISLIGVLFIMVLKYNGSYKEVSAMSMG